MKEKKKTKRRTRCSHRLPSHCHGPSPVLLCRLTAVRTSRRTPPRPWPSPPPPRARLPWPVTPRHIPRRLGPWRTRCGGQRRQEGGGLEEERRKQKGGRGVLTACRPAAVTAATTSLAFPSSSVGAPPVAGPAQAHILPPRTAGVPAVEDNDNNEEGG